MHVFHNRTFTYRCQHYGCHACSCFHAWLVTVWRQDKLSTSVYLVLHPHPYQNTFSGIYRSGIHACEAGASKIHDFLLHMQLGPWCKQRPLPSFAVSTKSSNPFLKHACIFSNKLERYKHIPFKNLIMMRHCDVLAILDASQSFMSCYPHLHPGYGKHIYMAKNHG